VRGLGGGRGLGQGSLPDPRSLLLSRIDPLPPFEQVPWGGGRCLPRPSSNPGQGIPGVPASPSSRRWRTPPPWTAWRRSAATPPPRRRLPPGAPAGSGERRRGGGHHPPVPSTFGTLEDFSLLMQRGCVGGMRGVNSGLRAPDPFSRFLPSVYPPPPRPPPLPPPRCPGTRKGAPLGRSSRGGVCGIVPIPSPLGKLAPHSKLTSTAVGWLPPLYSASWGDGKIPPIALAGSPAADCPWRGGVFV